METLGMLVCFIAAIVCIAAFAINTVLVLLLFVHVNKMRASIKVILTSTDVEAVNTKLREWKDMH